MLGKRWLAGIAIVCISFAASAYPPSDPILKQISKDKRLSHALGRLTFGPQPRDLALLQSMGVDKWIEQQLQPETIPENPVLETRLRSLDSLWLDCMARVQNYPPPLLIRQMVLGKFPYPTDPDRKKIIRRWAEQYQRPYKDNTRPEETPAQVFARLLSPDQQRLLQNGTAEQKLSLINFLPEEVFYPILEATPQNIRYTIFAVAPPDLQHKVRTTFEPQAVVAQDLIEAKLYRAIYSNR